MLKHKALIIEDEPKIYCLVRESLKICALNVVHASTLESAEQKLHTSHFDVIVLDRMLPDGDGMNLLSVIHESARDTRVLMLTDRNDLCSRVMGLSRGADDYMGKPFQSEELAARVSALLRRTHYVQEEKICIQGFCLDLATHKVKYNDENIHLTSFEFELLYLLLRQPSHRCSRDTIEQLWPLEDLPSPSAINVLVRRLRRKMRSFPVQIQTHYGTGYELKITQ